MSNIQKNGISYKQRVQYLLIGSVAFLVLAWYLSFSKTWTEYRKKVSTEQRLAQAANVDQEIAHLQQQMQQMQQDSSRPFSQEQLFELVTERCQQQALRIIAMPEARKIENNGYQVYINQLELEGAFVDALQLIFDLERKFKMGQVVHSSFKTVKNRETKREELITTIHLQNIQSLSKNEK